MLRSHTRAQAARQRRGRPRAEAPAERRNRLRGSTRQGHGREATGALQHLHQVLGALEPVVGRFRHHRADDLEQLAPVRSVERRSRQFLHEVLVTDREGVFAVEGDGAGQALIGDDAEGVDVAPPVERLGPGLFGAHVMRRPDGHPGPGELAPAGGRLGDAEVRHHRVPVLVEHDVVGLDVAVHDSGLVGVGERAADLGQHQPDLPGGQRAAGGEHGGERLTAQELHHEVDHAPRLADAVDRDDVRMLELGRGARFALEALDEFLVEGERKRQDLDGDVALELALAGLEDDRHASAAQLLDDVVLLFQLLADQIDFRDLRLTLERRRRQVQTAGPAELTGIVVLGAAAGAIHPYSEGIGQT